MSEVLPLLALLVELAASRRHTERARCTSYTKESHHTDLYLCWVCYTDLHIAELIAESKRHITDLTYPRRYLQDFEELGIVASVFSVSGTL